MSIIKPKHYYFIGIGGISMSGIASLLVDQGYKVTGSDSTESPITKKLARKGIEVKIGHNKENITSDIDFVIYSSAIHPSNQEYKMAKKMKVPLIKRSEIIGTLMNNKYSIAVSGMHGKTTVTAMLALILEKAGLDPTALIGTEVKEFGGNYRVGESDYFVAEACEYYNAFLDFKPKVGIITNIEKEHLDYFGNFKRILKSFTRFVEEIPENGLLIICKDNKNNLKVIPKSKSKVVTYGFDETSDVVAFNVKAKAGFTQFDIRYANKILKGFELYVPGIHNVSNACACIALALQLRIDPKVIKDVLKNFHGTGRRYEILDKISGITLISDYAHHPTEIKTTLEGTKNFYPKSRIICIFQPHQYKRTKSLFKDFSRSFNDADLVIIPNIYKVSGRDTKKDMQAVSAEKLVNGIKKNKCKAKFIDGFEATANYIAEILKPGDILLIMGAGDIYKIHEMIIENIKNKLKCEKFIKDSGFPIKRNIKLGPYTTFKIGGPADLFFETNKLVDLKSILVSSRKAKLPIFILGGGSNILISDKGFRGLVIRNNCRNIKIKNNIVIAESGATLSEVAQKAVKKSLSGLEFATGIPGTIGGAVVNNAGMPHESISNILTRALIVDEYGEVKVVNNDYFKFRYRYSRFKRPNNKDTILKVELQLKWAEQKLIKEKIKNLFEERKKKQPYGLPSAGSIFKNPSIKHNAGYLIEKAGLKKKRVGKATVAAKHANFIVTNRGAKAEEVAELIRQIKETVNKKYNIALEKEIQYIGEWDKD